MTKTEKLNKMEKFWKSEERHYRWEDIEWEPLLHRNRSVNLDIYFMDYDVTEALEWEGYYFHSTGFVEEAPSDYWDRLLLFHLNAWHSLPERYNAPILLNKKAMVVCIALPGRAHSLALLFQDPDSVILGLKEMDAEEKAREAARLLRMAANGPQISANAELAEA